MARPTIPHLANAAGVSVSTVNRVLSGSANVRPTTMQRVLDAANEIGFYGLGSIQSRIAAARPRDKFAVLLQQPDRQFYRALADHIKNAADDFPQREIDLRVSFLEDLSPDRVAEKLIEIGEGSDGAALVAAAHPLVSDAIERLDAVGVPVTSLITPLSAQCGVGYVGLDNWKVGRTAAWAFDHICRKHGKIGILVGSHRYRNQDLNESGFRSYFREHGSGHTLLEPLSTFESSAVAREVTERLLADNPDLAGLYVSGGGITGALAALRDSGRAGKIVTVGYDLFNTTKAGLSDGSITFLISHPFERLAHETIRAMIQAKEAGTRGGGRQVLLNFEIYTRENI